ncbi:MAG: VWA domain-containing protein [Acidobacteria bacterium]|nr:VWA domain-containing protein [Acidobacteriota bacterium]
MRSRSSRITPWRAALAAVTVAGLIQVPPTAAQILSRQSQIVFQVPSQPDLRLSAGAVEVVENGAPRKVLAVEPVAGRWRILVYFDMPGSTPEGVEAAAEAIGQAADQLVALGDVEIVTADRLPETVLDPTDDPEVIRQTTDQLALQAGRAGRLFRLRARADSVRASADTVVASRLAADLFESFQLELDVLAWQRESLLEAVLGETSASRSPRVLFLVQDAVDLDLGAFARRVLDEPTTTVDSRSRGEQRRQRSLTRTIAALGWRVYPMLVAPPDERVDSLLPGRQAQQALFAQASAGEVVTDRDGLTAAIERLTPSWRVRYESTGMPDGAPHPVDVRISPSGVRGPPSEVAARRWATVAAPSDLVALRAAQALDMVASDNENPVPPGSDELAVRSVLLPQDIETLAAGTPSELVTVDGLVTFAAGAPKTSEALRVTLHGRGLDAPPLLLHRLGAGADLIGGAWRFRTLIDLPIAIDELVLIVEDLRTDRWRVAFLEAASQPLDARSDTELLTSDGTGGSRQRTEAEIIADARAGEHVFGRTNDADATRSVHGEESEPAQTLIRLLPPRGQRSGLSGRRTFDIVTRSDAVRRVEFYLDGELVSDDKRRPFSATIDLGEELTEHVIQAIAYSRSDAPLGRDELPINRSRAETRIAFKTVTAGPDDSFDVEADVRLDEDERLDRIEFYRNERLAATLNRPPWRTRLPGPAQPGADFARLAVYLEDGSVVEEVRFLSADDLVAETLVNLVEVYAVINDEEGNPITSLSQEDFVLRAGRREIPIERFAVAEDVPLVLGLAVDTSGSMMTIMPDVRRAAAQFLGSVLTRIDQAFVVDFDSRPRMIASLTHDVVQLIENLDQLQADGLTALYDAMQFGLVELARDQGRRALVILTDGDDYGSQSGYRKTLRTAENSGVPIYVLSMANTGPLGRGLRKPDLEGIAKASGGRVYYVANMQSLLEAYDHISRELQSQYMLGYSTDAPLTQKEVQSLKVELRAGKGKKREIRMTVGRGRS